MIWWTFKFYLRRIRKHRKRKKQRHGIKIVVYGKPAAGQSWGKSALERYVKENGRYPWEP